ncbi:MAG: hypothetical protein ACOCQR_02030 [bacterium]
MMNHKMIEQKTKTLRKNSYTLQSINHFYNTEGNKHCQIMALINKKIKIKPLWLKLKHNQIYTRIQESLIADLQYCLNSYTTIDFVELKKIYDDFIENKTVIACEFTQENARFFIYNTLLWEVDIKKINTHNLYEYFKLLNVKQAPIN